jgi:hypothetical protein
MNDSLWTVMEMPMKHRMMAEPACVVKELCFWLAWLCEWSYVVFSWFLGSTGYKTILHVHCHVYILYIFYHTRLVGKCTHVLCDCVVFSFSPVSCSRNPGCSTAPQLGVECSSVLCWLQCFEDCQGDRMGQNLRPGNGGTVNGTPVGVTVLFMSQCSYGRIWKLDMPPK